MAKLIIFFLSAAAFNLPAVLAEGDDDCPSTKINGLGCYDERSIGLFTKALPSSDNNTILDCTGRCRDEDFQYAALLNGTGCSCGNLQPHSPHRQPPTQCNVDCPRDPSEKCGGPANRIDASYVEPFGCDWIKVVESTDKNGEYHATNVVFDVCTDTTLNGKTSFWVAPDKSTWLSAHFIVEIGCEDSGQDGPKEWWLIWGTRDFRVEISKDMYQWEILFDGTLPPQTPCSHPLSVTYKFKAQPMKYIRFVARSYYGDGAGLEHFNVYSPEDCGDC